VPNPNAIVDVPLAGFAADRARSAAGLEAVSFAGGRSALLDRSRPEAGAWREVLDSMGQAGQPIYTEIDPATRVITTLLIPLVVQVESLRTGPGGDVEVDLLISQGRHYLRRANPDFEEILKLLEEARANGATLAVTERLDGHDIIDVRVAANPKLAPSLTAPQAMPTLSASVVTLAQARQMFNLAGGRTCCPAAPSSTCIPFAYPDDGCWGRAHEMCRLFIGAGIQPDKVWIYGRLHVVSQNKPDCNVYWGWHVAPTLQVNVGRAIQTYVIDPSLFPEPVPQATWAGVQGDAGAQLVPSTADVFHRSFGGAITYDPTYTNTQSVLNTYRNSLRLRSTGPAGPPPYLNCLAPRPGVQWYGTIGPNASGRWFTFGWPAAWHMIWTVMPITACAGSAQLTWTVQVERANATQATYWITVRNLTANSVRFEGRYDILRR
jgi:hypothetical protein